MPPYPSAAMRRSAVSRRRRTRSVARSKSTRSERKLVVTDSSTRMSAVINPKAEKTP